MASIRWYLSQGKVLQAVWEEHPMQRERPVREPRGGGEEGTFWN